MPMIECCCCSTERVTKHTWLLLSLSSRVVDVVEQCKLFILWFQVQFRVVINKTAKPYLCIFILVFVYHFEMVYFYDLQSKDRALFVWKFSCGTNSECFFSYLNDEQIDQHVRFSVVLNLLFIWFLSNLK